MTITRRSFSAAGLGLLASASPLAAGVALADRATLVANARQALSQLEAKSPGARALAARARASLVFPTIIKAGFIFGGQSGDGVLFQGGAPVAFYNLSGGSWGLQAGAQGFSYALFFMDQGSLDYLKKSQGWAIGTGPSITVVNQGAAGVLDSTTLTQGVYAYPFNAKGLMADLTLQGTKITEIHPK